MTRIGASSSPARSHRPRRQALIASTIHPPIMGLSAKATPTVNREKSGADESAPRAVPFFARRDRIRSAESSASAYRPAMRAPQSPQRPQVDRALDEGNNENVAA